ncbi:hypothetical protein J6590_017672 [Homalodisca vitripennis]|nr:hypothetical protein J6590_017672 [Homalodisca vitripennis]
MICSANVYSSTDSNLVSCNHSMSDLMLQITFTKRQTIVWLLEEEESSKHNLTLQPLTFSSPFESGQLLLACWHSQEVISPYPPRGLLCPRHSDGC